MRTEYFIAMDTHCRTTDACIKTAAGKLVKRVHASTTIPHLRAIIESVPRPRRVTFEESSMAGWLYRNLAGVADEIVVCDPRRNAYIARDGDKDDAIDTEKLNNWYRSGNLRVVHQSDSSEHAANKQLIGMYHDRVAHRVSRPRCSSCGGGFASFGIGQALGRDAHQRHADASGKPTRRLIRT